MTMAELGARSAFSGVRLPSDSESVVAIERRDVELALVLTHGRNIPEVTRRMRARYAVELPHRPQRVASAALAVLGTGPGSWLAIRQRGKDALGEEPLLASLDEALGGLALVSDQTDAWGVLQLTGPRLREALTQLVPIDLDARVFTCGCVACTVAASSIAVALWRLQDVDGWPTFECTVPRSLAASFAHALLEATET